MKCLLVFLLIVSSFSLAAVGTLRSVSASPILVENFEKNSYNHAFWHPVSVGFGPTVSVANESLQINIPADSTQDPLTATLGAALTSNCELQGDFDLQVGFKLLMWPSSSGVRTGIGSSYLLGGTGSSASSTPFVTSRDSFGYSDGPANSEVYLTNFADGVSGITLTNDQTGMLRLARIGGSATGYFFNSGGWIQIHTGPVSTANVGFGFGAWSGDQYFSHVNARVAFDNFTLNSGNLLCPTLKATPSSGPAGTTITIQGSGFPIPEGISATGPSIKVTFDDQFIGTTSSSGGSFNFVFNVPLAQAGQHLIKATDTLAETNATTTFLVTPTITAPLISLTVGTIYFPGDTAVANALVTTGGVPLGSNNVQLTITLTRPDNSQIALNITSPGSGLFRAVYQIPRSAAIGTYSLEAFASLTGVGSGAALATFEVKLPWLSSQSQTAIIGGGIATAGVAGVALVSWRMGLFQRRPKNQP